MQQDRITISIASVSAWVRVTSERPDCCWARARTIRTRIERWQSFTTAASHRKERARHDQIWETLHYADIVGQGNEPMPRICQDSGGV